MLWGGVDGGDLRINADLTIASGSQFMFNQGESIISGTGSIISGPGAGSFGNGDLYFTDADSDGHAPNAVLTIGSGGVRAKDASGTSDCMDTGGGASYVSTTSTTTASDNDQDGYTDTSGTGNCRGTASQSVGGRTYYRDTSGGYGWLIDSQKLGTSDCNDGASNVAITRTQYNDNDGDGYTTVVGTYCASTSMWGNTICTTGGSIWSKNSAGTCIRSSVVYGPDCLDSSGNVHTDVANQAEDTDQDRHYIGSGATRCVGDIQNTYWRRDTGGAYKWITTGSALGSSDCCDNNANANPDQTAYFPTAVTGGGSCSNNGGYDYDCSGSSVQELTQGLGQCIECQLDEECFDMIAGSVGWEGISAPACGSTGNEYIYAKGIICSNRDEGNCETENLGCNRPVTTQECR